MIKKLDPLYLLFGTLIVSGVCSVPLILTLNCVICVGIIAFITYRDEVLKKKSQPLDEIKAQLDDLQSEVSALKIHEGMKNLR